MDIIDAFLYLITRWEFVAVTVGLLFMLPVVFSIASMDKKPSRAPSRGRSGGRITTAPAAKEAPAGDEDSEDDDGFHDEE